MTFEEWLKTQPALDDSQLRVVQLVWQAAYSSGWDSGYNAGFKECEHLKEIRSNLEKNSQ